MKKIVVTMFTALFLLSCNDDVITEKTDVSQTNISSLSSMYKDKNKLESDKNLAFSGKMKRSIDDIKKIAVKVATNRRVKEGIVTKSPLQIKSIEVVNGASKKTYIKTKGAELNDDAVLINFEGSQGYVLVSPDKRVSPVLGFSSYGNLTNLKNSPVQVLFSRIPFYVKNMISDFERVRPELKKSKEEDLFKKLNEEKKQDLIAKGLFDEKGKRVVRKSGGDELKNILFKSDDKSYIHVYKDDLGNCVMPLLKTLWGDRGDYNDSVNHKLCDDDEAPLAPQVVAMGQIMAYHKYPSEFKGRKMHWDEMTKVKDGNMFSNINSISDEGNSCVYYLLAGLGEYDLLDVSYNGCSPMGYHIKDSNVVGAFKKLGYHPSDYTDFNVSMVSIELNLKRPVYMSGNSIYGTFDDIRRDGQPVVVYDRKQGWVIDGKAVVYHIEYDLPVDFIPGSGPEPRSNLKVNHTNLYFHNNFGWGGDLRGRGKDVNEYSEAHISGWYIAGIFDSPGGTHRRSNYFNDDFNSKTIGWDFNDSLKFISIGVGK